jgi:hypothetical protein
VFRTPQLPFGTLSIEPVKLQRTLDRLAKRAARGEAAVSDDDKAFVAWLVSRAIAGDTPTVPRKVAGAMIMLLPTLQGPERAAAIELLESTPMTWRKLWHLYEHVGLEHQGVCHALARRLAERAAQSPKFRDERMPQWLPKSGHDAMSAALAAPAKYARMVCEHADVALENALQTLQLSPTLPVGQATLLELIRSGSEEWWQRQSETRVLAWGQERPVEIQRVLCDRLLCTHGQGAVSAADVRENRPLAAFVDRALGDPLEHPGVWAPISERARQVYEWLLLKDELAKIFEEFRRNAEAERALFWEGYLRHFRDARYHKCSDTAVCMMVIGNELFIEFGKTGNACYVYVAPQRPLRSASFRRKHTAGAFKTTLGLELGQERLRYATKMNHNSRWRKNFADYIGVVPSRKPIQSPLPQRGVQPSLVPNLQSIPAWFGETDVVVAQGSGRYHRPSCSRVVQDAPMDVYEDRDTARNAGLFPCYTCKP